MDSILSASTLNSAGQLLIDFPVISSLFLGAIFIIRGEISTLLTVYLISQDYLGWARFIAIALVSIILGDILLYYIGKFSRNTKFSSFVEKKFDITTKLEKYIKENTAWTLFLTKYTMGLGSVAAVLSGWSEIKFRKFFWLNSLSITVWLGVMTALSSVFINILGLFKAKSTYESVGFVLAIIVIGIFALEYSIEKYFTKSSEAKS
ncbi:MAG: DedA family protein [Candidatus Magasanikbacteria bacterium]